MILQARIRTKIDNKNRKEDKMEKKGDKKKGLFSRLKKGLGKARQGFTERVDELIKYYREIDDDFFDELEEILITADVGVNTTIEIVDELRDQVREKKIGHVEKIRELLREKIVNILANEDDFELKTPTVFLVVGVNGVGKTTTIGKLANLYKKEGKSILMAAGDTFRAAATEQLQIWGDRSGVQVISQAEGSDPAAVIFDAVQAARARDTDLLICDTAGRLHSKKNLMKELEKINRVIDREYPTAQKEVLLVLDATTGQNAVAQAKLFKEAVGITGIVLTKLDGTAKGGVIVAIKSELDVPIRFIGVGEQLDDLQPFVPQDFAEALFGYDE
ncbi:MAG: signal recognition particle-docking protein FtsY [Clostridiales bacterium]|nr:signal recognition particle-docking protein FtsY [Clostridiales bacterium]